MKKTLPLIAMLSIAYLLAVLGACATTKKTNSQKCAELGGTYTAATRMCQFQSE